MSTVFRHGTGHDAQKAALAGSAGRLTDRLVRVTRYFRREMFFAILPCSSPCSSSIWNVMRSSHAWQASVCATMLARCARITGCSISGLRSPPKTSYAPTNMQTPAIDAVTAAAAAQ